jgi:serine/threonine protein kinase
VRDLSCPSCGTPADELGRTCSECGSSLAASGLSPDSQLLERLGRALGPGFEVMDLLGRGGFADVYQVRDLHLHRMMAVKVLRPEIAWGPWMISRFEREARALANLNHLNIPPVHFVGDNEGLVYYVMPLIQGHSLGDILADTGPIPGPALVDIMIPVLEALDHAHHLGIVHRDIKPDNIIIERGTGRPLLVDFGVAKQVEKGTAGASLPGVILGTPGYISPEQVMAQDDVDARSDIYAVGATMFHCLTGSATFHGDTAQEIIGHQLAGEVPDPARLDSQVPAWLTEVIVCALSSRREDRFQSAAAMAEALREGRRAGEVRAISPLPEVERIRDDDPTPRMVKAAETVTGATPWHQRVSAPRRQRGSDRPGRRFFSSYFSWTLLFGLAGTVAAYFLLVPLRFVLRNDLILPVEVSTDDGGVQTLAPGSELALPLPADGQVLVRWFVVEPRADTARRLLGEPISGIIRVDVVSAVELVLRRVSRSIDTWSDGAVSFAPRVHNGTSQPLLVKVNRLRGGSNCDCSILPGETLLLGYYRLDANSFVRVEDARGKVFTFDRLESRIDLETGILDLQVTDTILSRSPR